MHENHQGMLKCIFFFGSCGVSLRIYISNKLPGDHIAAGAGTKLLSIKTLEILKEKTFISLLQTAKIR